MTDRDRAFYRAWAELLDWLREYSAGSDRAQFTKESDFTDYIYRMHREYDLPTTVMVASLSDAAGKPVLMLSASPRASVFKEVVLHPFNGHVYRKLTLAPDGRTLAEGKRPFTRERLFALADELFSLAAA